MDVNKMRNIVILKDLPSNIVEEAFVVLKKNQKIPKLEHIEKKTEGFSNQNQRENEDEYVVKEAELLVANYIDNLENQNLEKEHSNTDLMGKYKRLKLMAILLGGFLIISIGSSFFR